MRDSMKTTVGYQFMYIIMTYFAAAAAAALFGMFIFYQFTDMNIAKQILSVCLMIVEAAMLYVTAKKFASRDIKNYTPLKESRVKGAMFGVSVAALKIILVIVHEIVWAACSVPLEEGGRALGGAGAVAYNFIFNIITFSYNGFMTDPQHGHIGIVAIVLMIIVPIAATTLGYIAGCKRFELAENLDKLIYEKEDKEEGKK